MKLFTLGPVEMGPDILKISGEQPPYFRTPEFSELIKRIEKNFLKVLNAPEGSRLLILTASGTGAMEAAVCNALTANDKVLVISGGSFGRRFEDLCRIYRIPFTPVYVEFGCTLTDEMLKCYEGQGYTALLVNLHETSTGQLYDGRMLGKFCRDNGLCFIVDAMSTFLADPLDMKEIGADLVITSSQKALALDPGLSFIVSGNKINRERILKNNVQNLYFDLKDYFYNMDRGQTPYTPAVNIICQLEKRLEEIITKGLEKIIEEHKSRAVYFRRKCKENGIYVAEYPLSNALTPIVFENRNAYDIFTELKEKYNIMLTPSSGSLAHRLLRVGHLGSLCLEDYDEVVQRLKEVI